MNGGQKVCDVYVHTIQCLHHFSLPLPPSLPPGVSGSDQTVTCTDSQLKSLLDRSLVLSNYPLTNENDTTPTDVELVRRSYRTAPVHNG